MSRCGSGGGCAVRLCERCRASTSRRERSVSLTSLSRLDVYVWDYLTRRGFNQAAQSLVTEAGMVDIPQVPLRTPQGLLFE